MKWLPENKQKLKESIILLAMALLWNSFAYWASRMIAGSWPHFDITGFIDNKIPFVPWMVVIYFGSYIFWAVNYYICANQASNERSRYFCADAMSKAVCIVFFIAFPTTNIRPEIPGDPNIWNWMMRFLYSIDSPDNLFPSMHCLVSWLCWIGVRKRKDISVVYRYISLAIAIAICVSTVTTKQHVIIDVAGGILLAELSYFVAGFEPIRRRYGLMLSKIFAVFSKKENR